MKSRRVVITGLGTINPLADNIEDFYTNLIAGKSGITRWRTLDMTGVECKIGGDLGDYDWKAALEEFKDDLGEERYKKARKLFRSTTFSARLGTLSALQAYRDSGLFGVEVDRYRTSVIVPGHNLNSNYIFEKARQFLEEPEYIDPLAGVEAIDPNVPAIITEVMGLQGPTFTIGGACASGNLALRDGFRDIITGECERAIIAGAPFDVSPADIQAVDFAGKTVIQTTSAGTQGFANAKDADELISGSFVNAEAIVSYIKKKAPGTVSLVCMGTWAVAPNAEDTACAEYIAARLNDQKVDKKEIYRRLKDSKTARIFFDPAVAWAPEADFDLCLNIGLCDFVLKAEKYGHDLLALKPLYP